MAGDLQIVPARASHVRAIAARMRKADVDEVFAASGRSPIAALAFSLRRSAMAWTVLIDGRPEVLFGVADINILAGVGAPWLLGTDAVDQNYVAFLRGSVAWRNQLLSRYAVLRNFVDARNVASMRWLRWLGFSFSGPIDWRCHVFYRFELRAADVRHNDGSDDRLYVARSGGTNPAGSSNRSVTAVQCSSPGNECHARGSAGEGRD